MRSAVLCGLLLVLCFVGLNGPPLRGQESSPATAPAAFAPLDLPAWVLIDDAAAAKNRPWILLIDDPQCPYCMRLHHILAKLRTGDGELRNAVTVRLPFPLPGHDQSVHIVEDAFCLEASRAGHEWSGNAYLDWLLDDDWQAEPGWTDLPAGGLAEDAFFDAHYESHRVRSSRRREYQTAIATREMACTPGASATDFASCRGDADCNALCVAKSQCLAGCAKTPVPAPPGAAPAGECSARCGEEVVGRLYGRFSRVHSTCLLDTGPDSAQARTAAAFKWAMDHHVPGTPTLYVGHPSIGFREPEEAEDLGTSVANLRRALAEVRARLQTPPR